MKKDSLEKKIAAYVTLAAAYLAAHPVEADAQIMYTDVNPDLLINHSFFNLDLNNDGETDLQLLHSSGQLIDETCPDGCSGHTYSIKQADIYLNSLNKIVQDNNCFGHAKPMNLGDTINEVNAIGNLFSMGGNQQILDLQMSSEAHTCLSLFYTTNTNSGCFPINTEKYLGLKIVSDSNNYYGWARIQLNSDFSIVLKDYAINSIPDSMITAGDIGAGCSSINNITSSPSGTFWLCDSTNLYLYNATDYSIQWMRRGIWLTGETDSVITIHNQESYQALVSDSVCSEVIVVAVANQVSFYTEVCSIDDACGASNAFINITMHGNGAPYTYSWSNGATTQDVYNISAGNYQLIVTAAHCNVQDTVNIQINANPLPPILTESHIDSVCNGDASIDVTVTGGTPPYQYEWNNGEQTEDLIELNASVYTLTVTDDQGCLSYIFIQINNLPPPFPSISIHGDTLSVNQTFNSYQWIFSSTGTLISGATNQNYIANQSAAYSVIVTDANGCTNTSPAAYFQAVFVPDSELGQFTVTVDDNKTLLFHLPDNSLLGAQIDIINELGQLAASVTVTNQTPSADLSALPGGIYFYHIRGKQKTYSGKFIIE